MNRILFPLLIASFVIYAPAWTAAQETLDLESLISEEEEQPVEDATTELEPGVQFDIAWARALLERVMARLAGEFDAEGKSVLFLQLKGFLTTAKETVPYRILSEEMGVREGALKMAVHRLRRRYAMLLREEIARTVVRGEDVDEELRYLIQIIGTHPSDDG